MERAAKLKQVKVAESNSSEFKPIFEAKQFAESSGSDRSGFGRSLFKFLERKRDLLNNPFEFVSGAESSFI